jgi:hypothetical protein
VVSQVFAVGAVTRTGAAVLVALQGTPRAPLYAGRWDISLLPRELPVQPYHAAEGLGAPAAAALVEQVERAAERAATDALSEITEQLPPGTGDPRLAVVVKAVSAPSEVYDVLRSHAWMHAAEGVLYREALLAAGQINGWPTRAIDISALPAANDIVVAIGRAAGRPWRRPEKDASRAALTVLSGPP